MAETPDPLTLDRVLDALADGPVSLAELCDRLGTDPDAVDGEVLWDLLEDPQVVTLGDGRWADGARLAAGHRALHRVDEEEVASRALRLDEDVAAQVAAAPDPRRVTLGTTTVTLRAALDDDGEEDPSQDPRVEVPEGWCPDLAPGDVVAVSVGADGGLVVTADDVDPAGEGEDGGAAALVAALGEMGSGRGTPLAGDGDPWVLDLVEALLVLLADAPEVLDGLRRPLREVLDEAGMAYGGGFVAAPGVEAHRLRLFQVGADVLGGHWADPDLLDQAEAVGTTWMLLMGAGDEDLPERARALAVAAALAEPEVPIALARNIRGLGDDGDDDLLDRVAAAAAAVPDAPGPAQLWAEVAVRGGRADEVVDPLAAALADADPEDWADAIELLGHLRAVAGDLDGAARALGRIGLDDSVGFLGRWRAPTSPRVGRNDPCPCGSGRKYKQCCLGRPVQVALAERAELVWWKARTWALRTQGLSLPWSDVLDESEDGDADALVLDLALVADECLAAFTVELGSLLPADEADLVERWLERPHRLWEVGPAAEDGTVPLTDLTGPADASAVTVVAPPTLPLAVGEVVLALVVPTGDGPEQVLGQVVRVPPSARDDLLGLLADHPTAQVLLDRLLELGPDALVHPAATPS
ncbi:SEC-C metal-binding domain-containing protein [Iamia majanohamensis]|uniref:SEC-C metal-binding domain-containing protein n=1 Tax=Iamia majanohamensis TaxID=467976 RepID=A0AAF0BVA8_9ACTN|nr:SEC-C metal-binding domain-containing protein [Iamia majanohamensis]WCO66204.1 SEC-C metal-binding domain-containing protein [Iamia majanohamensis]